MPEVEVPFTDQEVDTSDPAGSAMTVLALIAGFTLMFVGSAYGQRAANYILNMAPASGQDNSIEVV